MQNAECRMQNDGIRFADELKSISEGNTFVIIRYLLSIIFYLRAQRASHSLDTPGS